MVQRFAMSRFRGETASPAFLFNCSPITRSARLAGTELIRQPLTRHGRFAALSDLRRVPCQGN